MKATYPAAIERFQERGDLLVNINPMYATYISGVYHHFFATEAEAIACCSDHEYGAEFNGTWFQSTYTPYLAGELFMVKGERQVYCTEDKSRCVDAIVDISDIPFLEWADFAPGKFA